MHPQQQHMGEQMLQFQQHQFLQQMQQQQQVMSQVVQSTNYASPKTGNVAVASQNNTQDQQASFVPRTNPTLGQQNQENNPQNQHANFLPQMSSSPMQQPMHHPGMEQKRSIGFPDPNSVTSLLAQTQYPQKQEQSQQQLHPQPQQQQLQNQIQIGLHNGQTIPLNAVPAPNGSVYYQIDPSVTIPSVNPASLQSFTKAINDVSNQDNKQALDPETLAKKRQQRLARNRESARQSRRRKKEHLNNMAAKVGKLQRQLDEEVRNKIGGTEVGVSRQRAHLISEWLTKRREGVESSSAECARALAVVLRSTGTDCPIRRAIVAHQYNIIRRVFLSAHNRYSVWMLMQNSVFFTGATDRRSRRSMDGATPSADSNSVIGGGPIKALVDSALHHISEIMNTTSAAKTNVIARANSKQIGEEIYYDERDKQLQQQQQITTVGKGGKGTISCNANDQLRMWPLFCHQITMTMEQEDRIIHKAHVQ